ncbi:hypothetical protein Tco_0504599 [Tanacetum coccineum]
MGFLVSSKESKELRELELVAQKICGTKVCEEQKQKLEDTMLELLEDCRQKEIYYMHNDVEDLIESALNSKLLSIKTKSQRLVQEQQEVKNIAEPEAKRRSRITSCLQNFKVIHKEKHYSFDNTASKFLPLNAITPVSQPFGARFSRSMGDDELIKSSVENLVQIPSESEDFSDNESDCDVFECNETSPTFTTFSNPLFDSNGDFTSSDDESLSDEDVPMENFKIYSNPLFDNEEIISTKIEPHYFNAESDLIESLLNRDISTVFYPKIDSLLEEFSGELAHIDLIPPGINKADFDPEEEIRLIEELLYDNSSPRPLEESNSEISDAINESPSSSSIPVMDSDSLMEEINLFLASDDSMPPGIEDDDYDSEGDICVVTTKVVKGISEHYVLMPNISPTLPTFDPDLDFTLSHDSLRFGNKIFDPWIFIEVQSERLLSRDEFSISFIRDPLSPVIDTLLSFSSKNEDKVFNPSILIFPLLSHQGEIISNFSKSLMMISGGDLPHLDVPFFHFYPP